MPSGLGVGISRRPVLSYRIPDLMVFQVRALRQDWQEKDRDDPYVWKAPQLLVECLSPANRKGSAQKLLDDYATIKAPEVWLLYPKRRLLKAYAYREGILREMQHIENGLVYPLQLPNVEVDLSELWRAFEQGIF